MSHRWGLRCVDCDSSTDFGENRSADAARIAGEHGVAIGSLLPLAQEIVANVTLGYGYTYPVDIVWFAEHGGHKLVPEIDYGVCIDECGEAVSDEGPHYFCRLPKEHGGAHGRTRPM